MKTDDQSIFDSFEELFALYYSKVKRFALSLTGNPSDADEIAQTVFIKLWNHRDTIVSCSSLDAYVFRVSRNAVNDFMRHKSRLRKYKSDIDYESLPHTEDRKSADSGIIASELSSITESVVKDMPEKRREVYILSRNQGKSNEEIARMLGLSKRTVEKHIQLALHSIRDKVDDYS
ncbi:MAG: RNA polymerase sigma-70 factor [Bacteroidales bacterium]|nr:RNA polymerase sigma-70 factor [Candidatus Cryptobacteroides aphodequi]